MTRFIREAPITFKRILDKAVFDVRTGLFSEETYSETFTLIGNIQPATPEMISRMSEGTTIIDFKQIFLHERLQEDDLLVYDGNEYTVEKTSAWPDDGHSVLPHYMYLAEKIRGVR